MMSSSTFVGPLWACLLLLSLIAGPPANGGIIKDIYQKITNTNNKTESVVDQSSPICGSGLFTTPNEATLSPQLIFITNKAAQVASSSSSGYSSNSNINSNSNSNFNHNNNHNDYENTNHNAKSNSGHSSSTSYNNNNNNYNNNGNPNYNHNHNTNSISSSNHNSNNHNNNNNHDQNHNISTNHNHNHNSISSSNYNSNHNSNNYGRDRDRDRNRDRDRDSSHSSSPSSSDYSRNKRDTERRESERHPSSGGSHTSRDQANSNKWSNYGPGLGGQRPTSYGEQTPTRDDGALAREYTFHVDNVTLGELERRGFNPQAPTTILMHGFTSGYPLQAWISAIVEAYSIDRASNSFSSSSSSSYSGGRGSRSSGQHNLFIVNWNYAARGILYPRAVANIPIVASYVTRFINDKLLGEARVDPDQIELVGHSLGAHLAGFIGKNTRQPLGRIVGLDPAGPCFGSITGSLYPSERRLAPGDARDVLTVHTNSALLGIDKPLGRHSVFVEGGSVQPGCNTNGGVLKSIQTLTWDGSDFDKLACSHSRAPNLLTYRHDQSNQDDDCQLVAYACKDWDSFVAGHCGVCSSSLDSENRSLFGSSSKSNDVDPMSSVECRRVGLDWQYYASANNGRPGGRHRRSKNEQERSSNMSVAEVEPNSRRARHWVEPVSMFMRTGNTPPYCTYHYRIILELNEPFPTKTKPPMSLILQDTGEHGSSATSNHNQQQSSGGQQNSLTNDQFGFKFNPLTYTHLLTSNNKLKRIDQATLIFREGLADGHRLLKSIQVNYMSHSSAEVRKKLSSRLCAVKTDTDRGVHEDKSNRIYFKPCGGTGQVDDIAGENSRYQNRPKA